MYSILPAFVSALFLGFGAYVLLTEGVTRLSVPFALMCATTFFWQGTWAFLFQTSDAELAAVLVKAGYFFILFLPTTFYHFVIEVSGRRGERSLLIGSYALSLLLAVLLRTGNEVVDGYGTFFFGKYPQAGTLHPVHVAQTVVLACRSAWLLFVARRQTQAHERRRLLDLCLFSLCLYGLAASDYAVNYGAAFYPMGAVFIAISLGILAVTIVRYGLMRPYLIAAAVAHEVATPLAAIGMHAEEIGNALPELMRGYQLAVQHGLCADALHPGQVERLSSLASSIRRQVDSTSTVVEMSLASLALDRFGRRSLEMGAILRQPVYHPVSVVFLDDSADFLHALRGLFPDAPTDRYFTSAREALAFVASQEARQTAANLAAGAVWSAFEKNGGNALGEDVMADAARFGDIAALVVDYEMPEMNGLEFLAAVKDLACTRILLTAVADESRAVEAFNAGLIDFYVKKSDPAMTRKLRGAIDDAKRKFCARRGHIGLHGVGAVYANRRTADVLHELAQRERLVEYYWRPDQNAVLTFDVEGNAGVFLAWDARDCAAQCDVVADEGGPGTWREEMAARRFMPVFWPHEAYRPGMARVEFATPKPVPGLDDAHTSWTRIGDPGLASGLITFAAWRAATGAPGGGGRFA